MRLPTVSGSVDACIIAAAMIVTSEALVKGDPIAFVLGVAAVITGCLGHWFSKQDAS